MKRWFLLFIALTMVVSTACAAPNLDGNGGNPFSATAVPSGASQGGTQTGGGAGTPSQAAPTTAPAPPAAPTPSDNYTGIAPPNAPQQAAVDIGFITVVEPGADAEQFTYTGGSARWFGMRQTTKNVAKTYEVSCSTNEWVWFVDAVTATFHGVGVFSQDPQVVMVDLCPFERTRLYVFDGQIGAVKRSDVPWAIRDRNVGFRASSGRVTRLSKWDGSKLVPVS